MSDPMHDAELRALFDAQRRTNADLTPSFADVMARAHAHVGEAAAGSAETHAGDAGHAARRIASPPVRRNVLRHVHWRKEWAGALAAAAAIAAVIVIPRMHSGEDAFEQAVRAFEADPALGAWQSPTDALLHLPGDGLLSTVPSVELESQ